MPAVDSSRAPLNATRAVLSLGPTGRRTRTPLLVAASLGLALAIVFLLLPPLGTDLSAAEAHGDFALHHPLTPIDMRWYGGFDQFGYSLLSQHVAALVGSRLAGALSALAASVLFADVLRRSGARRPLIGAVAGTVCIFANLVSGRIAFAIGLALGLAAVDLMLARRAGWSCLLAVLCAAVSPVAGLFLGVVAAGLVAFPSWRRHALVVGAAAGVPLLITGLLFGNAGSNTFSSADARHAGALLVAVLVCARAREVRAVTVVLLVLTAALWTIDNPVGLTVMRLPVTFAIPLVLALTPRASVAVVVAAACWWYQPPVLTADWHHRDDALARPSAFRALSAELERRVPAGRVEVVPTREVWEAARVASAHVWLARGWLRQADTRWNPLFFHGTLADSEYHQWIRDNAVQYVALPRQGVSWVGRREASFLAKPPAWLTQVWQDTHWRLFVVADPTALVESPASVTARSADFLELDLPQAGSYEVKIRYSRYLSADGPVCVQPSGQWTRVTTKAPRTVRLGSSLLPHRASCG